VLKGIWGEGGGEKVAFESENPGDDFYHLQGRATAEGERKGGPLHPLMFRSNEGDDQERCELRMNSPRTCSKSARKS